MRVVAMSVLLLPSLWFAWANRDMPQLGRAHDDAIYLGVAKSWAEGHGYRVANLPGEPWETKYPPLVIGLLAVVWRLGPAFPANLPWLSAVAWLATPPFLYLSWMWLGRIGFSTRARLAGLWLLAWNPYTVSFGAGVYTELWFGVLILASLLLLEKKPLAAGFLAGLGVLTRTSGVAAIAIPLWLFLRGERAAAVRYSAGLAALAIPWLAWASWHKAEPLDLATLYNTDYVGFLRVDLRLTDIPTLVWENLGRLLYAVGGLAFAAEAEGPLLSMLRITAAVAILHGVGMHVRKVVPYAAFAAGAIGLLLVWNFPPNLRLLYPLAPLLVAGLLWELQHLRSIVEAAFRDRKQRSAARVLTTLAAALATYGLWTQVSFTFFELPRQMAAQRRVRGDALAAFAWLGANSAPEANVLSLNPAVYLYTGRHTQSLFPLPINWYRHDSAAFVAPLKRIPESAYPIAFLYVHASDETPLSPDDPALARRALAENPRLEPVFRHGEGVVYRVATARLADSARQK
jgi:hypothetical protein